MVFQDQEDFLFATTIEDIHLEKSYNEFRSSTDFGAYRLCMYFDWEWEDGDCLIEHSTTERYVIEGVDDEAKAAIEEELNEQFPQYNLSVWEMYAMWVETSADFIESIRVYEEEWGWTRC